MKEFERKLVSIVWVPLILSAWFLYIHRNSQTYIESPAALMEYLSINVGYNFVLLHGSIYLGIFLIIVHRLSSEITEQYFIRITRTKILKKQFVSALISSIVFTALFCGVQIIMLSYKVGISTLKEYNLGIPWILNYIRLCEIYLLFGMIHILSGILLNKKVAPLITIVICIIWIFIGKYADITNLHMDFAVYDAYYSPTGLNLLVYSAVSIKHITMILVLYFFSAFLFQRKDILNGKR